MLLRHIGLVSETTTISFSELGRVSAALQKQAMRDLAPVWGIQATCDAFAKLEDVPLGHWPMIVEDDINTPGAAGVHEDHNGQPFALISAETGWSLTASHEMIEMLVDPFGRRITAGQSPKPGQKRVEFLVEPCDPSEAVAFSYVIDGVTVSDFYTPKYFSTVFNSADRYSHTGAIKKPRQVLKGGYLSWHDPVTDHWFQETFFSGTAPKFTDLGKLTATAKSFRRQIYDVTHEAFDARRTKGDQVKGFAAALVSAADSTNANAAKWRAQIASLTSGKARKAKAR
jgi:hypothetical protein